MLNQNRKVLQQCPRDGEEVAASRMVQVGLLCGVIAPVLWVAVIVTAGALRPGFDHVPQYISELGERGSATEVFMRYGGFVPTGLMHVAYAAAFHATVRRISDRVRLTLLVALLIALNGIGRIGAGVFACEPGCAAPEVLSQRLHSLSATLAFLSIAAATIIAAAIFRGARRLQPLGTYSLGTGLTGLMFMWLMSSSGAQPAFVGLYERLASGVLSLWVMVSALWLLGLGSRR